MKSFFAVVLGTITGWLVGLAVAGIIIHVFGTPPELQELFHRLAQLIRCI